VCGASASRLDLQSFSKGRRYFRWSSRCLALDMTLAESQAIRINFSPMSSLADGKTPRVGSETTQTVADGGGRWPFASGENGRAAIERVSPPRHRSLTPREREVTLTDSVTRPSLGQMELFDILDHVSFRSLALAALWLS
jgi:hypothetical protein